MLALQTLKFLIVLSDTNTINTSKGVTFDTLAAHLLSLVILITELLEAEVWNVKNAWLSGRTVGLFCHAWVFGSLVEVLLGLQISQ